MERRKDEGGQGGSFPPVGRVGRSPDGVTQTRLVAIVRLSSEMSAESQRRVHALPAPAVSIHENEVLGHGRICARAARAASKPPDVGNRQSQVPKCT